MDLCAQTVVSYISIDVSEVSSAVCGDCRADVSVATLRWGHNLSSGHQTSRSSCRAGVWLETALYYGEISRSRKV
jgi:hypothetical protein